MHTWNDIESMICSCGRCALGQTRKNAVPGKGSHAAQIMLVAEAPGKQEDLQGIPFVGPAGKVLDILLTSAGLSRKDVFITNIVNAILQAIVILCPKSRTPVCNICVQKLLCCIRR